MNRAQETELVLDLSALAHNYSFLKSKIKPGCKFMGVVKANSYGSDSVIIAKKLEALGVDYLAVAYVSEGVLLRESGIETPILVLHPQPTNFEEMVSKCLEPSIYSIRMLEAFTAFAHHVKLAAYPIHLKFNTGLNRLGFHPDKTAEAIDLLKVHDESVLVRSAFTHLAASDDRGETEFTLAQLAKFEEVLTLLRANFDSFFIHATNTSGILNYPQAHYDMVRAGIGLYGYGNEPSIDAQLKPVGQLLTVISQIHHLKAGESIGYNRAFKTAQPMRIATLPIGHADGINRSYGRGKGWVIINGERAPIVGNVCMDMIMVDVTNINCNEGDTVQVFGQENSAEELAKASNSISYELLTAVSGRIKRTVIDS